MSPEAASRHPALLTLGLWAAIAAAAVVPGAVPIAAEAADVQPVVGHRAPDFTLKTHRESESDSPRYLQRRRCS